MTTVFYILSGRQYIEESRASCESVKRHMPGVKTVLFTPDNHVNVLSFDEIHHLPCATWGKDYWYVDSVRYFGIAIECLHDDKLVFLDSDTRVILPFDEMLDLIGPFDLVAAHAPARVTGFGVKHVPLAFPELNIGVMGLSNTHRLQRMAEDWLETFTDNLDECGNNDQASLRQLLWEYTQKRVDFRFYAMTPEWNCRLFGAFLSGDCHILHGRSSDMLRMEREANAQIGMRLWKPT